MSSRTARARRWARDAARRICEQIRPEKILLFGSYASGRPRKDSDIDLLIVWDTDGTRTQRYQAVSRAIGARRYPVDIVIKTPAQMRRRAHWVDPFFHEVMTKGIVLYDRDGR